MTRPRIVIPEVFQDVSNYTNAMYAAGMEPIVVSLQSIQITHRAQREFMDIRDVRPEAFDGLLIPGGEDINPDFYGETDQGSHPADRQIDCLQLHLLEEFIRLEKPILGICRGMQLINVWFGGSLIQHLDDAAIHMWKQDNGDQVHASCCVPGSWLCGLYGDTFYHNSSHHQAVHRLADGLAADSRCPLDDVIESLHHTKLPIYAVQWHPERMCLSHERGDTVNGLEVFRFFCRLCGGCPPAEDSALEGQNMSEGMGL